MITRLVEGALGAETKLYPAVRTSGRDLASFRSKAVIVLSLMRGFREKSTRGPSEAWGGPPPSLVFFARKLTLIFALSFRFGSSSGRNSVCCVFSALPFL